jgi:hypothetical protein
LDNHDRGRLPCEISGEAHDVQCAAHQGFEAEICFG